MATTYEYVQTSDNDVFAEPRKLVPPPLGAAGSEPWELFAVTNASRGRVLMTWRRVGPTDPPDAPAGG
jgi:hypothetical protein